MGKNSTADDGGETRRGTAFDREVGLRLSLVIDLYDYKAEAAKLVKKTGEMLTRYSRGEHKLPFHVAATLAHGKGVSLDWLATGEGPMLMAERTHAAPESDAARHDPLDEALLANVVEGLELFAGSEDLELEPAEKGRLVVLLHRMLARRRRDLGRQGLPLPAELTERHHPVAISADVDFADIVRLAGRRTAG